MKNTFKILIAEDDLDDQFILKEAFRANNLQKHILFVENGVEVMEYLNSHPQPSLMLLDLNMPMKSGKEVLQEVKSDERFMSIPVIVFSSSNNSMDIYECFELGADSYMTKPGTFAETIKAARDIYDFCMKKTELGIIGQAGI